VAQKKDCRVVEVLERLDRTAAAADGIYLKSARSSQNAAGCQC
jgi:hypothetical protein